MCQILVLNCLKRINKLLLCHQFQSTEIKIQFKSTASTVENKFEQVKESVKQFHEIPGPSKFLFVTSFLPGGKFYKKTLADVYKGFRMQYGDIVKIPGVFGKRDIILTFDANNFEKVYRTEGLWPLRRGLDSIEYYRKEIQPEIYSNIGGLVAEQGKSWSNLRTAVNPVMMQPKTVKLYIPSIDNVTLDFLSRIYSIRDNESLEMPGNFEDELNRWALEAICVVALDARLGLINDFDTHPNAKQTIESIKQFFKLVYQLDVQPSIWKMISTPKYRQLMRAFDNLTKVITEYIDDAKRRLDESNRIKDDNHEQGILEKLLKVDKHIAYIMAMDMLLAGVDTTSSAATSCLYLLAKNPEKQNLLRQELKTILPKKESPLTVAAMKDMPYLRACIKESLRILPVTIANFRSAGQDIILNGYHIPKGSDIAMGNFFLQMEDAHFPQANKFIPERWLRKNQVTNENACPSSKTTNPFVYLPFGFGPRTCIGRRFAELEVEVLVARIIRNFIVNWNYPELQFDVHVINVPINELRFQFVDV